MKRSHMPGRPTWLIRWLWKAGMKRSGFITFPDGCKKQSSMAQKTIELEPQAGLPYALLALAYADLGQRPEAIRAAEKGASFAGDSPSVVATAASALARAGQHARAKQLVEHALDLAKTRYVCRFIVAGAYADLGETERAFDSLELAFRQRST